MRVLIQRVNHARVSVEGQVVGKIDQGLLLLVGATHDDTPAVVVKMAEKVAGLRIFNDQDDKMNLSLLDIQGQALVVSQFTLYADAKKGRRPNFIQAAKPEHARPMVDIMISQLHTLGVVHVGTGQFGAHMKIDIQADGPVSIWLDSNELGMR